MPHAPDKTTAARAAPPRWRRHLPRALLALAVSLVLALVGAELGLRYLMFADDPWPARLAARMRKPALYASNESDDLYWTLQYGWAPEDLRNPVGPGAHPLVGWRSPRLDKDLHHEQAGLVGLQRPVLLYGDSFADCVTPERESFHPLFEETPLGDTHELLNFGVGGYGFDQTYLLLRATLDDWADRNPVVILSLLQKSDLNRTTLSFRGWTKPRLHVPAAGHPEEDQLLVEPPAALNTDAYLELRPPRVASYLWLYLLHGTHVLPRSWAASLRGDRQQMVEKRRIVRAILEDTKAQLDARGLDWFVLLFVGESSLRDRRLRSWEGRFLLATMRELEIPYVTTRDDLRHTARREGRTLEGFYIQRPDRGSGHLNVDGNRVVVQTMLRGLAGDFDPYEFAVDPGPKPRR